MMFSSRRSRNRHSANPNPKLHSPYLRRKISAYDGRSLRQTPYPGPLMRDISAQRMLPMNPMMALSLNMLQRDAAMSMLNKEKQMYDCMSTSTASSPKSSPRSTEEEKYDIVSKANRQPASPSLSLSSMSSLPKESDSLETADIKSTKTRKRKSEKPLRYDAQLPVKSPELSEIEMYYREQQSRLAKLTDNEPLALTKKVKTDVILQSEKCEVDSLSLHSQEDDEVALDLSIKHKSDNKMESTQHKQTNQNQENEQNVERHSFGDHYSLSNWLLNAVRQTQLDSFIRSQMKLPQSISVV